MSIYVIVQDGGVILHSIYCLFHNSMNHEQDVGSRDTKECFWKYLVFLRWITIQLYGTRRSLEILNFQSILWICKTVLSRVEFLRSDKIYSVSAQLTLPRKTLTEGLYNFKGVWSVQNCLILNVRFYAVQSSRYI